LGVRGSLKSGNKRRDPSMSDLRDSPKNFHDDGRGENFFNPSVVVLIFTIFGPGRLFSMVWKKSGKRKQENNNLKSNDFSNDSRKHDFLRDRHIYYFWPLTAILGRQS
ncbi:MAG: hypothetical protein LBE01_03345, partial [Deltaproteobacteria bacterium]|nr:hypothetical protein [Deltaproteobacteria bacterium]